MERCSCDRVVSTGITGLRIHCITGGILRQHYFEKWYPNDYLEHRFKDFFECTSAILKYCSMLYGILYIILHGMFEIVETRHKWHINHLSSETSNLLLYKDILLKNIMCTNICRQQKTIARVKFYGVNISCTVCATIIGTPRVFPCKQVMQNLFYCRCNNYMARKVWFCVSAWTWCHRHSHLNCLTTQGST